jgi:acetylornithine deacetylase/succinyl-diaminopimelate desuccinylase-like protein
VCDGSGQEGGRWGVRVATKGALGLEITTRGVAVHASRPAQGKNAVLAAADALLRLSYSGVADRPAHPVLGVPTLVAGTMIQGGTTANTIPATCRATVDCRLVPGLPVEDLIARVTEIVAGAAAAWGCTATVAVVHHTPSVSIDPAHPLVRMACEAIGEVTGQQAAIRGLPGGNDARHLVAHGIPTVIGLSPSDSSSSRSHGADENVGLADVVTASHIYAALVRRWASSVAPAE